MRRTADILGTSTRHLLVAMSWLVLLVAFAAIMVFAIGPRTGEYRTLTVLSGSMRPLFDPGDSIVVRPVPIGELREGDVITYNIPVEDGRVVTHRIVKLTRTQGANPVVVTKGDANGAVDAWEAQLQGSTAWVYDRRIPKAGYALRALRDTWMQRLSYVAIGLFTIGALWRVWAPQRRDDEAEEESA